MSDAVAIQSVRPSSPEVQLLIRELDALQLDLYPAESNHLDPVETLEQENVRFVGAFVGGKLMGCGAVKVMPAGYGEIKRMYVRPEARGLGVARRMLQDLETHLVRAGVRVARLETGVHQPEAVGLYESNGYREIGPFGGYAEDPLSIFMEKELPGSDERNVEQKPFRTPRR